MSTQTVNPNKKRVVVICPGRGTYNKEELGYLQRHHADKVGFVAGIDRYRKERGQVPIAELDGMANYSLKQHTAGENASALIYACAMADLLSINRDKYEIVGVTGNSMGWYIALAAAGALNPDNAIHLINTMGSMMKDGVIGGQIIYPVVDENWHISAQRIADINDALSKVQQLDGAEVYPSIELGGYRVFGGNAKGLITLMEALPEVDSRYPMNLFNHAAFHTPLLQSVADTAQAQMKADMFSPPSIPLIDGGGNVWQPHSSDIERLYHYTLQTQVVDTYQFGKAIEVAIKEFAPDKLVILGPGATLGGAVAQCLIAHQWQGIQDKAGFIEQQKNDPFVLVMGLEEQRKLVI